MYTTSSSGTMDAERGANEENTNEGSGVVQEAQQIIRKHLCKQLFCQGCGEELVGMTEKSAWRSRNCEHLFCTLCARRARGDFQSSAKYDKLVGRCPVKGCHIPVGPIDIVQDNISIGQIIEACAALVHWSTDASSSSAATETTAEQTRHEKPRHEKVPEEEGNDRIHVLSSSRRLFDNDSDDDVQIHKCR